MRLATLLLSIFVFTIYAYSAQSQTTFNFEFSENIVSVSEAPRSDTETFIKVGDSFSGSFQLVVDGSSITAFSGRVLIDGLNSNIGSVSVGSLGVTSTSIILDISDYGTGTSDGKAMWDRVQILINGDGINNSLETLLSNEVSNSGVGIEFSVMVREYTTGGSYKLLYFQTPNPATSLVVSDPNSPPIFDVAPSVTNVTSSGFTPSASSNKPGVIYYVVVADGATAPNATQVKAGIDATGSTALASAYSTVSSLPFTSSFSAITSLLENTAYDVYFVAEDDETPPNVQSSVLKVDTTTLDATAPTLSSSSPSDNATGVAVGANIVLTFNENVQAGTGNIVISDGASDTRTIAIGDGQVSISGAVVTINPTANLNSSTTYYVQVASTAVEDISGNAYAGISDTTTLNFTTVDTTAPTLTFSPSDSATDVAADANITITFSEAVRLLDDTALSDTNVDALITLKDTNSSGSNIAFDATVSGNVITINPTNAFSSEQTVYVAIGATVEDSSNNAITASSATFTVAQTNSPALDFAANETAIRTVLVDDMMRAVRSSLNASARMMSDVRGRLRGADGSVPTLSTRSMPLEIDGAASADAGTLSTRGTATASLTRHSGAYRRLFFSDFDIQHDLDTDNTTATLSARVAWEHMVADGTLLGYYVGAEASQSDINGTFAGDQTRLGLNVGGYIAHRLAETLFTDAYLSLGVGHSELDMSNGTLALESDYRSETVTVGASVSGSYDYTDYEFRPELAVNYGKTQIGTVFFTGRAYGLVDDTLSLNAGSVSVANVTLRPEVIYAIQNGPTANTNASLSFSPRLICERTMATRRTQNCGSGGEVGYTAHSNDGLRNIDFRFAVDKVGSSRRSSAVLGVEMRF